MPIDFSHVDWVYTGVLAVFVFMSSLIGSLLTFRSRGLAAILAAVFFVVLFVLWTYYPHGLPLPTRLKAA